MELRDYLKLYWAQRWIIGGIAVVLAATAFILTATQPVRYASSESFAVNRINPESTPDYQYDGYYALQAVDIFSKTVESWFETPSFLNGIYGAAQVDPEIESITTLPSRFSVKRYSAQNIVVRFTERTQERAEKVSHAVANVLMERTSELNRDPQGRPLYEVIGSNSVIAPTQPNPWLYGVIGLFVGFGLGLFVAAARHYLR